MHKAGCDCPDCDFNGPTRYKAPENVPLRLEQCEVLLQEAWETIQAFKRYTGAPPRDNHSFDNLWEDAWGRSLFLVAKLRKYFARKEA